MLGHAEIRGLISGEVRRLLLEHGDEEPVVSDESDLVQLGMTSLMFAELLIELESALDVDPFQEDASITEMRTVGALIATYQKAVDAALVDE